MTASRKADLTRLTILRAQADLGDAGLRGGHVSSLFLWKLMTGVQRDVCAGFESLSRDDGIVKRIAGEAFLFPRNHQMSRAPTSRFGDVEKSLPLSAFFFERSHGRDT